MKIKSMKIVLASQSGKKVAALQKAFADVSGVDLVTYKAPSGVHEQPIGDETLQGAANRIAFIKAACPDADLYVSIENGLFEEGGEFVDRAVVTVTRPNGQSETTYSDGVVFPKKYVEQTRDRDGGFEEWTVGKTMAEQGVVKDDGDPHLDLAGKSRVDFLNETVAKAVAKLGL